MSVYRVISVIILFFAFFTVISSINSGVLWRIIASTGGFILILLGIIVLNNKLKNA